jgi:hypothetical protein
VGELFVIADHPDPLADRFASYVEKSGWAALRLTYAEAALRLSISRRGPEARVCPAAPLFVRLPFAVGLWEDTEAQFHRSERWSLIWAAGALTQAPVINRPDPVGLSARSATSTSILRSRSEIGLGGPEVYASHAPNPCGPAEEWWLEDQSNRATFAWAERGARRGPYRAGRVRPGFELLVMVAVGDHVFGQAPPEAWPSVGDSSLRICRALGVSFASVMWRWYPGEGVAEFARFNPHPTLNEIGDCWDDVASQLLKELGR